MKRGVLVYKKRFVVLVICLISLLLIVSCIKIKEDTTKNILKPELQAKIKNTTLERLHVQVNLNQTATPEIIEYLNRSGFRYLDQYDYHIIIVSVDTQTLKELRSLAYVSNISIIPIQSKILEDLLTGKVPNYVINEDSTYNVIVQFYKDVPEDIARNIVKKHGNVTNIFSEYDLTIKEGEEGDFMRYGHWKRLGVRVPRQSILDLTSEDVVSGVGPIEGKKKIPVGPIVVIPFNNTK